jgi:hypothetical protein
MVVFGFSETTKTNQRGKACQKDTVAARKPSRLLLLLLT